MFEDGACVPPSFFICNYSHIIQAAMLLFPERGN